MCDQVGDETEVVVDGAGIFLEVFLVVELDWVDEKRDDDEVVLLQSPLDERKVSFVQGAHGGHEAYLLALLASGVDSRGEFGSF